MPEKVNLVDKIPQVAQTDTPAADDTMTETAQVAQNDVKFVDPFTNEEVAQNDVLYVDPFTNQEVAPAGSVESTVTISALDNASYYGMLSLFIFFLIAAVAVFARRTRVSSRAPKKALLLGGIGLCLLAAFAFASKSVFSSYLNQEIASYPLLLKPAAWLVIAPVLVMMIPFLVTENPKAQHFFMTSALKVAGAFLVLTIGAFLDLGMPLAAVFGAVSLGLGIFFALPLFKALSRLPGNLSDAAKAKISQLGYMVVGISLAQIITGSLMIMGLPISGLLLADEILSFALVGIIFFNLMGYISIQSDEEVAV